MIEGAGVSAEAYAALKVGIGELQFREDFG